jgi:hypothetical protein
MTEQYEYHRFELNGQPTFGRGAIKQQLQPLGDDGWEIMQVGQIRHMGSLFPSGHWVEARRPPYGTPAPRSWEYTGFNVWGMPAPDWDNHIASRGWTKVFDPWLDYYFQSWYVFKRPDTWRGTDDGDILHQLQEAGAHMGGSPTIYLPWRPDGWQRTVEDTIREILKVKWDLSVQAGHDVETHAAVQHWLARL